MKLYQILFWCTVLYSLYLFILFYILLPYLGGSSCFKVVKMIMERSLQPVIIFSFSRRDCEALALQMSKLDFNSSREKELVEEVFTNAIDCLSDDDKQLPQVSQSCSFYIHVSLLFSGNYITCVYLTFELQVVHLLPLLKRGIGIHHSGLLPILKETIEILFSEGLIKALFATETFALGLNMPARTVVFTSARKFDGKDFRWVRMYLNTLHSCVSTVLFLDYIW